MHLRTDLSSNSHYAQVPTISRPRNSFSIADKHLTTIAFDLLTPIYNKFIYPGDTISITQKALARLSPQISVLYDDLYIDAHAWFVPMRLIQTNWARFQFNAQPGGPAQDNSALTTPSIDLSGLTAGFPEDTTYDYFGYPTNIAGTDASAQHINNYLGRAFESIVV